MRGNCYQQLLATSFSFRFHFPLSHSPLQANNEENFPFIRFPHKSCVAFMILLVHVCCYATHMKVLNHFSMMMIMCTIEENY